MLSLLQRMKIWRLWLVSVILSVLLTEALISIMSLLIKGVVQPGYLIAGLVASLLVASLVVGVVAYLLGKLAQSQLLLTSVLDTSTEGIMVADGRGHITMFNQRFADIWRLPPDVLEARTNDAALAFVRDQLVEPEQFVAKVRYLYANLHLTAYDVIHFKDGRVFERFSNPQYVNGKLVGRLWRFHEITDIVGRKRAEEALQHSTARTDVLLNSVAEGIYGVDMHGNCTFINAAGLRLLGYQEESELIGKHIHDLIHHTRADGSHYPSAECRLYACLQSHADIHVDDEVFWRRDGSSFPVDYWSRPTVLNGENGAVITFMDITERKKSELALSASVQELEQKDLAKTRFLAAAGHDLRQPLAAANLFIDALKFSDPTPEQEAIIHRLDQSMATFNGLLDALLNVSKLDAGVIKPEYTSINVTEVFNWLEQTFEPQASEKKLGFKLHFPVQEPVFARGDMGLVKSALMNLVSNAIKYTPAGGVLISARRRRGNVLFQVWDTGVGIPGEYINRIFDEFYQIDNPQRDRAKGLGLGLSIAKRALALLGGEIICRSNTGRGSVFEFRLPLDVAPAGGTQPHPTAAGQADLVKGSIAQGKRFVVVEDDVLVGQAMTSLLRQMFREVQLFHTAEDALRHANIEHADYFISDYMLGGKLNGVQFLNLLSQRRGRLVNAVLMTGDTSPSLYVEMAGCAWTVLHKPIKFAELFHILSAQES